MSDPIQNPLELSDEDFKKLSAPPSGEQTAIETPAVEEKPVETVVEPTEVITPPGSNEEETDGENKETPEDNKSQEEQPAEAGKATNETPKSEADPQTKPSAETDKPAPVAETVEPPDYEAVYKQIMAPFRANGRMVELKTPEEAIKLMQMGANYTRTMQQIAPHKRVLSMLQNNNLLDEAKLSYLIDLDKKNPDAIKKLVKDSGIDPLDINTNEESGYKPSNHSVTDEQVSFDTALEELSSTPDGNVTLKVINTTWDHTSKEALLKSPDLLGLIHEQRDTGVYDQIATEIERRRTLGQISVNEPFIQAYVKVGNELQAANLLKSKTQETQAPTPVATRTPSTKPAVVNDDKAAAASATKTSPKTAAPTVNYLAMSDEEFLNQMKNRV